MKPRSFEHLSNFTDCQFACSLESLVGDLLHLVQLAQGLSLIGLAVHVLDRLRLAQLGHPGC